MLDKLEEMRQQDASDTEVECLQNSGRTSNARYGTETLATTKRQAKELR